MSTHPAKPDDRAKSLEVPVDEALRRARPLPPREQMVIADLTADEDDAFWKALNRG